MADLPARNLLDAMVELVMVVDEKGVVEFANRSAMAAFGVDGDGGGALHDLLSPADDASVDALVADPPPTAPIISPGPDGSTLAWTVQRLDNGNRLLVGRRDAEANPGPESQGCGEVHTALENTAHLTTIINTPRRTNIALIDRDHRIVLANDRFVSTLREGYDLAIAEGDRLATGDTFPPFLRPSDLARAFGGEYVRSDVERKTVDGSLRSYSVSYNPVDDGGDRPATVTVFAEDVTEQRRLERDLRENLHRYQLLVNGVEDGIGITGTDEKILYINPAGARIFGYEPREMTGTRLLDYLPEDEHERVRSETERRNRDESSEYELEFIRSDGERRIMVVSAAPQQLESGETRTFGVFRDVTESRRLRRELESSLQRFRAVFEQANDAICIIDYETNRFIDANGQFLRWSGYTLTDLRTLTPFELTHPDNRDEVGKLRTMLHSEGSLIFDLHLLSKSGQVHELEASSKLVELDGQSRVVVVARDLSERRQAQRALRESETRFRSLITSSPAGICILDEQGVFEYANAAYLDLLGYEAPELIGRPYTVVLPQDQVNRLEEAREEVLGMGQGQTVRTELLRADGERVVVVGEAARFTGLDGLEKVAAFVVDITDREHAVEALRRSEAYNVALVRALPDPVFRLTRDGVFIDYSAPDEARLSLPRGRIIGSSIADLPMSDDLQQHLLDEIRIAIDRNQPRVVEYNLQDRGEVTYHEARLIPEREDRVLALVRDITERVREEERLRFQSQMLDAVQQAVVATDTRGRIIYWNSHAETMYGWRSDDVLGRLLPRLLPDNPVPGRTFAVARHLRSGQSWSGEVILQRRDGREIPVLASTSPIVNGQGTLIGTLGITTDITSRKEYEQALKLARQSAEEASAAKSSFLTNMSHEIRTPMNSILGFTELLGGLIEDPRLLDYLDAVKSSATSLMQLINDILDLSRIEAGRLRLQPRPVDLRDVLRDIRHLFDQSARDKGLEFTIDVASGMPSQVEIDDIRLRQILVNLVGNAVKFTDHGRVRVDIDAYPYEQSRDKVTFRIDVSDSGPGIPAAMRDRVFEDFYQIDHQDHRKFGGTGLGLAITRRLVRLMDGHIGLTSDEGRGTTMSVTLPAIRRLDQPDTGRSRADEIPEGPRFQPAEVLLAEDEHFNRRLVEEFLAGQPFTLIQVEDGATALARIHEHRPDLVLLDLRMPVMDGNEVLEQLRDDPRLRDIPVIVLSASLVAREEQRARAAGARAFLRKPLSRTQLLDAIAEVLPKAGDSVTPGTEPGNSGQRSPSTGDNTETARSGMADGMPHELYVELRDELIEPWNGLGRVFSRKLALELAERLQQLADNHQYEPLARYARDATRYIRTMQLKSFLGHIPGLEAMLHDPDPITIDSPGDTTA